MNMHLVVDRYLQDTLQDDEKAEFEERLLWDEELMDELDLAEHLREGLRASAQQPIREPARPSVFDWLSNLVYVPQYAAAASFVVAVGLTAALFMSPFMIAGQPGDTGTAQTEIIPLISTRSDDVQSIYVDQDDLAVLLVDDTGSHDSYRVTIDADAGGAVWTRDGLTATYPEALAIAMPGRSLAAGNYMLTLEGVLIDDSGNRSYERVQQIRFKVIPAN